MLDLFLRRSWWSSMFRRDFSALAKRWINAWVSWTESSPSESHFMQQTLLGLLFMDLPPLLLVTVCPHISFAIEQTLRSLVCDSCDRKVFSAELGGMPFIDFFFWCHYGLILFFLTTWAVWFCYGWLFRQFSVALDIFSDWTYSSLRCWIRDTSYFLIAFVESLHDQW